MGNICSISISLDGIFSSCQDYTASRAKSMYKLEDNLAVLQTELQKLTEARDDVITRVIIAEQQQMKRLNQVQGWLSRVQAVEFEVGEMIRDSSEEIEKLCLGGYCSKNYQSSYKFGKKVAEKLKLVATLRGEGAFQVVAERVIIPKSAVEERPSEPMVGLESTFDEVWRCLEENQAGIFGLYGMGGVGKTTLLTQINNKFVNTPEGFNVVIWVTVSKELQLEKIQENIGKRLAHFDEMWKYKSLEEKALEIFQILSKTRFVLLLDDVWERVDLTKVGVPLPNPTTASKVIFTTRFVEVCGHMETQRKFRVECLRHEEAWKLFQKKVGEDTLSSHPDIPEIAEIVAKECGGLPLALITIGRAMAYKKTPQEWRYAVQVLGGSAFEFPGMVKEVYPLLKFSYDSLSSDTVRTCFLYCSLFPEDYSVSRRHLIDCWIGEGFLKDHDSINDVQDQGYYIIGVLLHACLLEEDGDDCLKMHDVLRDMALWIACEIEKKSENFLVRAGIGITDLPDVEKWKDVRRISLMENQLGYLSVIPTCPHLQTLFLNYNSLETIKSSFFQYMPTLRVLNLSYNDSLRELPSGISTLVSLQHLDLSETAIKVIPEELKALINLKCLNLENTSSLHTIPQQLISTFSKLHVLRMFNCGFVCQTKDSVLSGDGEFLVKELIGLKQLNMLSISLKSYNALQIFLSFNKFQSCTQSLCLLYFENSKPINFLSLANMKHLDSLSIWNCKYLQELKINYAGEVQKVLQTRGFRSLQTVHIDYCLKLRDLTWLVLAPNLKVIKISSCTGMEEVISVQKLEEVPGLMGNLNPFGKLQSLKLHHLHKLKSIYRDALSFPHLKEMIVYECPVLRKLPLDSRSVKESNFVIEGGKQWWEELQWEDQATQSAFHLCFKSR
ncbi:probable disease resistance protein At5g63020 [Pistacia vera]|uniref:probable disease resistance protein At5g63020 n=1 Tax=Pistacia vera TaxID=55513 RepID=UPI0012635BF5|nr:probable disease resistance protein At5g63020 [Pistacia vera]